MDIKDSDREVTVVLDGESFTMSKFDLDYLEETVLSANTKEEREIVEEELSEEYIRLANAPSKASYESYVNFIGKFVEVVKGRMSMKELDLFQKSPYDSYYGEELQIDGDVQFSINYFDGEVQIELKENIHIFDYISFSDFDYDSQDYDPIEKKEVAVLSDGEANYEIRLINSNFYERKMAFLDRDSFFKPEIFKYIRDEMDYGVPYTPPKNFQSREFTVRASESYAEELMDKDRIESNNHFYSNSRRHKVLETIEQELKNNLKATIRVDQSGWHIVALNL